MSSEGASTKSFRDLVWQKAIALTEMVYALASHLPAEQRFGPVGQMRPRDSLAELETHVGIVSRLDMLPGDAYAAMADGWDELGRLLRGLRNSLGEKLATASR